MASSRHHKRFVPTSEEQSNVGATARKATKSILLSTSSTDAGSSLPRRALPPPTTPGLIIPSAAQKKKLSHDCGKLYPCNAPSPSKKPKLDDAGSNDGATSRDYDAPHPFYAYEWPPVGESCPIENLPLEVLHRILRLATVSTSGRANGEYLDIRANKSERRAILKSMLVCKAFRGVACPMLYRSVVLDGHNTKSCLAQRSKLLAAKASRDTNPWQGIVTTDDVFIEWRGRLKDVRYLSLQGNEHLRLCDIPVGKSFECHVEVLHFSALNKLQFTPELLHALLTSSASSLAELSISYLNKGHKDASVWASHIPALTALRTVTFPREVLASLPAVLADVATLEWVKVKQFKQRQLFADVGMDHSKIKVI
ncbi:hypothetical protein RQP46_007953 [Phenoliferia psychrophenolica]